MDIIEWIQSIAGGDARGAVADKAGQHRATFNRQYDAGRVPPATIVAIARAYSADPLRGLVAAGLLTEDEIANLQPASAAEFLASLTDMDLLHELIRRVDDEGSLAHPALVQPLDEDHEALEPIRLNVIPEGVELAAAQTEDLIGYQVDREVEDRHDT